MPYRLIRSLTLFVFLQVMKIEKLTRLVNDENVFELQSIDTSVADLVVVIFRIEQRAEPLE